MGIPWKTFEDIERRLTELERLVRHLYEHAGLEVPPVPEWTGPSDQVMAYIAQGKTLEAINQLRQETGFSLAEAKRVVDQFG